MDFDTDIEIHSKCLQQKVLLFKGNNIYIHSAQTQEINLFTKQTMVNVKPLRQKEGSWILNPQNV